MSIFELAVRLLVTISVLLILSRLNGPKQISQMNFYDYVVGITVGSLAATVTLDRSVSLLNGVLAIALYLLCGMLMSWLARKNMVLRRFLSGKPIVLIAKGEIQWHGLRRARMNMNELLSALRYGGYYQLAEIDYEVFEPTGKISVQPKGFARPPKTSELQLHIADTPLSANVIIDGVILKDNLKEFHKDTKWLMEQLKSQNVDEIKKVGLATLNKRGALSLYLKDDNQTKHSSLI